ncbi:hypothetical protein [Paenibacillus mendelii]|uniref:hypothetical protein n=1 Tax=Paenibacillus mendelii TaxID=206163 RepID=UPI0021155E64|nr:hypothetical protein [Paenibacillus mendelii]
MITAGTTAGQEYGGQFKLVLKDSRFHQTLAGIKDGSRLQKAVSVIKRPNERCEERVEEELEKQVFQCAAA